MEAYIKIPSHYINWIQSLGTNFQPLPNTHSQLHKRKKIENEHYT
jgi:hypothetical protein